MGGECQVCGRPAAGEGVVEGARVPLCETCAVYAGSFSLYPEFKERVRAEEKKASKAFQASPGSIAPRMKVSKTPGESELAEDFGKRIMHAREKLGLNRKELAKRILIQEKELDGFEQQKFKPNETVIKKLEFALGVKLTESVE